MTKQFEGTETEPSEHPIFVKQAEIEGAICGKLCGEGRRAYTRVAPHHFGPKRTAAWLAGYDESLAKARNIIT